MQKLSGISSLKGLRSLVGSTSTAMKAANPKLSSSADSRSYESLPNLKITAEKLVSELMPSKAHLSVMRIKLRRATEQINLLERKHQKAVNENAKFKVKRNDDLKLWQGLDPKVSSTKTLCDQLTETLQQLASQIEQAEEDKKFFEEMVGKNSKALDELNYLLHDLSTKLECAEQKVTPGKLEILQIKQEKEEMDRSDKEQLYSKDTMIKEKEKLVKEQASVTSNPEAVHTKLRREIEIVGLVEGKLQQAVNENAKLKMKKIENSKFWEGLDSKISLANTLCDQLTETQHQIASQTDEDSTTKKLLQQKANMFGQKYKANWKYTTEVEAALAETECQHTEASKQIAQSKRLKEPSIETYQVARIQQDNEHKESMLWAYVKEELQLIQSAEHELSKVPIPKRLFHSTAYMNSAKKGKVLLPNSTDDSAPGNTATIVLDRKKKNSTCGG